MIADNKKGTEFISNPISIMTFERILILILFLYSIFRLLSKNLKVKIYKTIILPVVLGPTWLQNMVYYIKRGMQAKSI